MGRKRMENKDFIKHAIIIHGEKYDYSLVNYNKSNTKITIICPMHGSFEQIANNHLQGQGCSKCAGNLLLTKNKFINNAKAIHGEKYDYSKVEYVNYKTKVTIICYKHGPFLQKPGDHTNLKQGCPKCAGVGRTTQDFIKDSSEIHDYKYSYLKTNFIKYNKEVIITCPIHGDFEQKPFIHLQGSGCQKCSESKGERKIFLFLKNNNISFEAQKIFNNCINTKTGCSLKFDFYLPDYDVCIEYDGEYHYEHWRLYFNKDKAEEKFAEIKFRDQIKTEYCKNNGISLLRIPYFDFKNIDNIISNYLFKNN